MEQRKTQTFFSHKNPKVEAFILNDPQRLDQPMYIGTSWTHNTEKVLGVITKLSQKHLWVAFENEVAKWRKLDFVRWWTNNDWKRTVADKKCP